MKHPTLALGLVPSTLAVCFCLLADPAGAQMMLPGALQAAPPSDAAPATPGARPGAAGPSKPRTAGQKAPTEAGIVGRDLVREGAAGVMAFQSGAGKSLEITRLSFTGAGIANSHEACRVDVVADAPIELKPAGRAHGLARYDAAVEACPFSLEILDGAVLVSKLAAPCDFAQADCRVDPAGLWGPAGDSIDDKQIKVMERERARAEGAMRTNFRALLSSAGKDKAAIKQIAADQAGFSSEREVACHNYRKEEVHGFCALRLTEARALALQAEFEARPKDAKGANQRKAPNKTKPKPSP
ncbi:hypothetical protein [Methylocapsa palsarum]|uniref:hypothetical protein n=1 Tax=Methylocapsa palsarum TaxID=1612308 RepID=UPI0011134541|nr:hypothetical protein [Methylocapsa palsarum]